MYQRILVVYEHGFLVLHVRHTPSSILASRKKININTRLPDVHPSYAGYRASRGDLAHYPGVGDVKKIVPTSGEANNNSKLIRSAVRLHVLVL